MNIPNLKKYASAAGLTLVVIAFGIIQVLPVFRAGFGLGSMVQRAKINLASARICNAPAYSQGYVSPERSNQLKRDYLAGNIANNQIINSSLTNQDPNDPTQPLGWSFVQYGNAVASAAYNRDPSASWVTVDLRQTGEKESGAKWNHTAVIVQPNSYMLYANQYKSNVPTVVTVEATLANGQKYNATVGTAPVANDWTEGIFEVFVPDGATHINVGHQISRPGQLSVKNVVLAPTQAPGFSEGLVSITFDDGYTGIYDSAYPVLKQYGLRSTQYIVSDYIGFPGYMNRQQLKSFMADGNEIGSHSTRHDDQTTLSPDNLKTSLARSRATLQQLDIPVTSFASPYGATNDNTLREISKCYLAQRGTNAGYNTKLYNPYNLQVQDVQATTTPQQIQQWLATAKEQKTWLILVYHDVGDAGGGNFTVGKSLLDDHFRTIKDSGLRNLTMQEALETTSAQINR